MKPDDPDLELAKRVFDRAEKKYQEENPCQECGSHNVHLEPVCINGPHSSWIEYCDDCGWQKRTET